MQSCYHAYRDTHEHVYFPHLFLINCVPMKELGKAHLPEHTSPCFEYFELVFLLTANSLQLGVHVTVLQRYTYIYV